MSPTKTVEMVRSAFKYLGDSGCFDKVSDKVKILTASAGNLTAELTVEKEHTNRGGTLHGGYIATLVDQLSTCAMMPYAGTETFAPGVSAEISVQYMAPARLGDTVTIVASELKKGKNLIFLNVDFTNKATGVLVARGNHIKFVPMSKM
ncbi:Acyl-coenzyme A thioesterase 13 [Halotydeus destructor]|nr:Acyl-coenzyme A thioesterase 13 [Halotydeus destructor]